ncbi:hypothetical protein PGT21_034630 [Puccinia graminis f. sp. tritici]|uniref:Uncharacterized protein n=1 Tax=Puccinia graminis f. sp. tritici TaxID=56615 RepID=A0A5B0RJT7_PUCGR|nr:hypothetical protein PGT21_034630 [Puccinia graminis f. sp. tritici]KAA1125669.1 hypothetical protein PGTUg99_019346 [Puccinia graminis f. sp. tritici]
MLIWKVSKLILCLAFLVGNVWNMLHHISRCVKSMTFPTKTEEAQCGHRGCEKKYFKNVEFICATCEARVTIHPNGCADHDPSSQTCQHNIPISRPE